MSPEQIKCRFDGNDLPPQDWKAKEAEIQSDLRRLQAKIARYTQLGDPANVRFSPRGSLGVVICNGTIHVKNVTVSRIPNP